MRKFRASMEPFWDLKISKYVVYLMPVSCEYIKSWVLLSRTSTAGRCSRVLLADVILWINKASLVLYIVHTLRAMPRQTWRSEAVRHCRVHLLWLKHRNLSLSRLKVGLRLHLCYWGAGIDVACRLHRLQLSLNFRDSPGFLAIVPVRVSCTLVVLLVQKEVQTLA